MEPNPFPVRREASEFYPAVSPDGRWIVYWGNETGTERRRRDGYYSALLIAICCEGLGQPERSVEWVIRAHEDKDGLCWMLNAWPVFDPLRADPRFQALLRRMNFRQQQ